MIELIKIIMAILGLGCLAFLIWFGIKSYKFRQSLKPNYIKMYYECRDKSNIIFHKYLEETRKCYSCKYKREYVPEELR